jgi:RNA polymerase sigma factor (TIGR02999 family)
VATLKDVSALLAGWTAGDQNARDQLIPLVYDRLRRLARRQIALERPGHSLQATALVNEVYLRMVDQREPRWQDRAHFFALAAQMMRHILVDHARKRNRVKRGAGARISLDEALVVAGGRSSELIALDDALAQLATIDPRRSQVVELRYFGGLSVEETAEVLKVSRLTVIRDWKVAKAWLNRAVGEGAMTGSNA